MALPEELYAMAARAGAYAASDEELAAVLPAESAAGERSYLCAFSAPAGTTWLALDASGAPITSRDRVREAVSIAALCEIAEDGSAGEAVDAARVASAAYLDALAASSDARAATALGDAIAAVEELARDVEAAYKLPLV